MITMKINYKSSDWETNYEALRKVELFLSQNGIRYGYEDYRNALPVAMFIENDEIASFIKMKFDV